MWKETVLILSNWSKPSVFPLVLLILQHSQSKDLIELFNCLQTNEKLIRSHFCRNTTRFLLKNIFYSNSKEKVIYRRQYFSISYLLCAFCSAELLPTPRRAAPLSCFVKEGINTTRKEEFTKEQATWQPTRQINKNKNHKQTKVTLCLNSVSSRETFHQEESYCTEGEQQDARHEAELERVAVDTSLPLSIRISRFYHYIKFHHSFPLGGGLVSSLYWNIGSIVSAV